MNRSKSSSNSLENSNNSSWNSSESSNNSSWNSRESSINSPWNRQESSTSPAKKVNRHDIFTSELIDTGLVNKHVTKITDLVELGPVLGQGGYGTVYLAKTLMDIGKARKGQDVAVKSQTFSIEEDEAFEVRLNSLVAEIKALQKAGDRCESIYKLYDAIYDPNNAVVYFILELIDGPDLFDVVETSEAFKEIHDANQHPYSHNYTLVYEEEIFSRIIDPLINAIKCLHSQNIAHKDIKLENVMTDEDRGAILVDFGLSCLSSCVPDSVSGTLHLMAPEALLRNGLPNRGVDVVDWMKVDVWAFCCTIYQLITGDSHKISYVLAETFHRNTLQNIYEFLPDPVGIFPLFPEIERFLHLCFRIKPEERWQNWLEYTSPKETLARQARLKAITAAIDAKYENENKYQSEKKYQSDKKYDYESHFDFENSKTPGSKTPGNTPASTLGKKTPGALGDISHNVNRAPLRRSNMSQLF